MASPKKLSHLVLQTNRRDEMVEWYCTVLGADLLYQNKFIAFISYDDEHHRVAFIDPGPLAEKAPSEGKTARAGGEVGLHHVAFTFDPESLADHYEELKGQGISPHRCVNHGMTTSMYYYDPDRNQVELLFDNFHTARAGTTGGAARPATKTRSASISIPTRWSRASAKASISRSWPTSTPDASD